MTANGEKLGILVGGGPAPGINSVISSVTIEAINSGFEVLGIVDGFQHLIAGSTEHVQPLSISDVSRIHFQGGSVLRTSRANPTRSEEHLEQVGRTLGELGITRLVTIGGDDTAFGASEVARVSHDSLRVVHVPKTIDNDLPLPGGMPTFGFETARQVGTEIVLNMMEDSRTTNRWYMVVVMGRTAGHLALGIGKSAGATTTIIPEEFSTPSLSLDQVCKVMEGAILKRRAMGQRHGLLVVAEGIGSRLDPEELAQGARRAGDPRPLRTHTPRGDTACHDSSSSGAGQVRRAGRIVPAGGLHHRLRAALRRARAFRHRLHAHAGLGAPCASWRRNRSTSWRGAHSSASRTAT